MSRVKGGTKRREKRDKVTKHAKGFKWGRKNRYRLAKQAVMKSWQNAYRDRRLRKRDKRREWQQQINAAARQHGMNYSTFINQLKQNNIELDRKVLAELAREHPETFAEVMNTATK